MTWFWFYHRIYYCFRGEWREADARQEWQSESEMRAWRSWMVLENQSIPASIDTWRWVGRWERVGLVSARC